MQPGKAEMMKEGARYLMSVLQPLGFVFRIVQTGASSGGTFCQAEFSCKRRKIELHFRWGLGMVLYHIGDISVSHKAYIEALGAGSASRYPGFYNDKMEAFRSLAHDFALIRSDFIDGEGRILAEAAAAEGRRLAGETEAGSAGKLPARDSRPGSRQQAEQGAPTLRGSRSPPALAGDSPHASENLAPTGVTEIAYDNPPNVQFTLNQHKGGVNQPVNQVALL